MTLQWQESTVFAVLQSWEAGRFRDLTNTLECEGGARREPRLYPTTSL